MIINGHHILDKFIIGIGPMMKRSEQRGLLTDHFFFYDVILLHYPLRIEAMFNEQDDRYNAFWNEYEVSSKRLVEMLFTKPTSSRKKIKKAS